MVLVIFRPHIVHLLKIKKLLNNLSIVLLFVFFVLFGCSRHVRLSSAKQLTELEFEDVGPGLLSIDLNQLVRDRSISEPYRVIPGDMIELTMPAILKVVTAEEGELSQRDAPYLCRVSESGTITLPIIGDVKVAGKSLAEIELAVIEAYHPDYTATRPSVVARVTEYNKARISIAGAVKNPGVYELRHDQMSLVALLMQAGGIVEEGASCIRITHAFQTKPVLEKQTLYQSAKPEGVRFASHYLGSNEADGVNVQMTFQQVPRSSTIGRLIIKHEQTVLLNEKLDITDENQRWTILDKLAATEPHVSTAEVGRIWMKLCKLAEPLKYSSGMSGLKKASTVEYVRANTKNVIGVLKHAPNPNEITEKLVGNPDIIVLPVKGLNIPFSDVTLQDGDAIVVERLEERLFTVTGLVNKPGNFPYPANSRYNLMQALAFAGGLDKVAEPRYATIYRLKADGTIVDKTFQIVKDSKLTNELNTIIKPGDIIDVANTLQTRTNVFWDRVFRVTFGAFLPLYR